MFEKNYETVDSFVELNTNSEKNTETDVDTNETDESNEIELDKTFESDKTNVESNNDSKYNKEDTMTIVSKLMNMGIADLNKMLNKKEKELLRKEKEEINIVEIFEKKIEALNAELEEKKIIINNEIVDISEELELIIKEIQNKSINRKKELKKLRKRL